MAQGDPYAIDPSGIPLDPVVADAYGQAWSPPPEFFDPWNPQVTTAEYGMPSMPITPQMPAESTRPAAQITGGIPMPQETRGESLENVGMPVETPIAVPDLDAVSGAGGDGAMRPTSFDNSQLPPTPGQVAPGVSADPNPQVPSTFSQKPADPTATELMQDPALAAVYEQDLEGRRRDWKAEQEQVARNREQWDREKQHKLQLDAQAKTQADIDQLNTDIKALSNTKVVRDRRSNSQRVLDALLGGLGGLVSARTGGPNVGLQMVMKALDDDVEIQKGEIAQKQAALGMRKGVIESTHQRELETFKIVEAHRIAKMNHAIAEIQTQAMQYDPKGTKAIGFAKTVQGLMQARNAAEIAAADRIAKTRKAEADLLGVQLENESKARKLVGYGVGGGAGAVKPDVNEKDFQSLTAPAWFKGTPKQWLDTRNTYLEGKIKEQNVAGGGKVGEEQREQELQRGGMGLFDYDANGKRVPFKALGETKTVTKFRDKKTGTREMIALLDEAMSMRTGWTSDKVKGEENVRLKAQMGKVMAAAKKTEDLGAITASDVDLMKGLIGTDDFTSWRGVTSAVDQARKNLIQSLRIDAIGIGMSERGAADIDFDNPYKEKMKKSADDAALQSVLNGEAKKDQRDAIVGNIYIAAKDNKDPKVRAANLIKLKQIAKDSPDELTRRSVGAWAAELERVAKLTEGAGVPAKTGGE